MRCAATSFSKACSQTDRVRSVTKTRSRRRWARPCKSTASAIPASSQYRQTDIIGVFPARLASTKATYPTRSVPRVRTITTAPSNQTRHSRVPCTVFQDSWARESKTASARPASTQRTPQGTTRVTHALQARTAKAPGGARAQRVQSTHTTPTPAAQTSRNAWAARRMQRAHWARFRR